jgi:hypothetical protein
MPAPKRSRSEKIALTDGADVNTIRQQLTEDQNTKTKFQELKFWLHKSQEARSRNASFEKRSGGRTGTIHPQLQKDIESHQQVCEFYVSAGGSAEE